MRVRLGYPRRTGVCGMMQPAFLGAEPSFARDWRCHACLSALDRHAYPSLPDEVQLIWRLDL
jgi:hypothetical protein